MTSMEGQPPTKKHIKYRGIYTQAKKTHLGTIKTNQWDKLQRTTKMAPGTGSN